MTYVAISKVVDLLQKPEEAVLMQPSSSLPQPLEPHQKGITILLYIISKYSVYVHAKTMYIQAINAAEPAD